MKKTIARILEGDFHPATGVLDFSAAKIEMELWPGEEKEGAFRIYGPPGLLTEGYVFTDCIGDGIGMELYTDEFAGAESEIGFCFHAKGFLAGDSQRGEFIIVSNHGEYSLPYQVSVVADAHTSSIGPVKNLFHFTNLAKTNWYEALNLFYGPSFYELCRGIDKQYMTICRGLSEDARHDGGMMTGASAVRSAKSEQNIEEFLLAIRKKQKIEYLVAEKEIDIIAPSTALEYHLSITRNGWGYTCLHCHAEGDFLVFDKEIVRDEDFLANVCKLPYYIAAEKLHAGKNLGRIHLRDAHSDISIPVTVTVPQSAAAARAAKRHREYRRCTHALMKRYVAFRTKQISQAVWRKESEALVEGLITADDKALLPKLFRVQLLITEGRIHEAGRLLNHADNLLQGREREWPQLWCYYIYLTTLENREFSLTGQVTAEVERFYARHRGDPWIGWLLCHLKEEYVNNPTKKWHFLKELGNYGSHSPVIYAEAWQVLRQNPSLFIRLDPFEQRLLMFAARLGLITRSLVPQIIYLVGKSKTHSPQLAHILRVCHEVAPSDECVQTICELLIKGGKTDVADNTWYRLGIEREIKVTRLYEHYLFSLDQEKEEKIPKQVLLYFAYNQDIDHRYLAYLYAYVHKNRAELPEIYGDYRPGIERFVARQLGRGRSGKWMAVLYRDFISADMVTTENAGAVADILFGARVTIEASAISERIREVIVLYEKGRRGIAHRVSGGAALVTLYGEAYQILLVDDEGKRYVDPAYYRVEKWPLPDETAYMIASKVGDRIGFDLWLCEQGDEMRPINRHNLAAALRLYRSDFLRSPHREALCLGMLRFYQVNDEKEALEQILRDLRPTDIERRHHNEVLDMMVSRFLYPKAYRWLCEAASPDTDAKLLLRILGAMIPDVGADSADRLMQSLAHKAFLAGKYNEKVLLYLARHFHGGIRRMGEIWQACHSYGLDAFELSERMLVQMLYSGTRTACQSEVFADYVAEGGKSRIVRAFLQKCAADYFIKGQAIDIVIIRQLAKMLDNGEALDFVCQLAYLKYYAADMDEIDGRVGSHLECLLTELLDQDICFAFFKDYIGTIPAAARLDDRSILEYRGRRGMRVTARYRQSSGQDMAAAAPPTSADDYQAEPLEEMFAGVYVKQFLLFPGEIIDYYIVCDVDGEESHVDSGSLTADDNGADPASRFGRLSEIEAARIGGDYGRAALLLDEYQRLEFLTTELFEVIDP